MTILLVFLNHGYATLFTLFTLFSPGIYQRSPGSRFPPLGAIVLPHFRVEIPSHPPSVLEELTPPCIPH